MDEAGARWARVEHEGLILQVALEQGSNARQLVVSATEEETATEWKVAVLDNEVGTKTEGAVLSLEKLGHLLHATWTKKMAELTFDIVRKGKNLEMTVKREDPFRDYTFKLELVAQALDEVQRLERLVVAMRKELNSLKKGRREVFRLNTGSFSTSSADWTDGTGATGKLLVSHGSMMWSLHISGHWTDSSAITAAFRLKVEEEATPGGTARSWYLPDDNGWTKYIYREHCRLEAITMTGMVSPSIPVDKEYTVSLQVKGGDYKWDSAYGALNLVTWRLWLRLRSTREVLKTLCTAAERTPSEANGLGTGRVAYLLFIHGLKEKRGGEHNSSEHPRLGVAARSAGEHATVASTPVETAVHVSEKSESGSNKRSYDTEGSEADVGASSASKLRRLGEECQASCLRALASFEDAVMLATAEATRLPRISFAALPDHVYDTFELPAARFLWWRETPQEGSPGWNQLKATMRMEVHVVDIGQASFLPQPQQLGFGDSLLFGVKLFDTLPPTKLFAIWIRLMVNEHLVHEAASHIVTLLHDSLKDIPPVITPDVFCFPQKVVMRHAYNCQSKATLSKRHKKERLRNGQSWCRNPTRCGSLEKGCICQAYPSRTLKKMVKDLRLLLEVRKGPEVYVSAANLLYAKMNEKADAQSTQFTDYNVFLTERVERWRLLMKLQEFAFSAECPFDVQQMFKQAWDSLWR